MVEIKREKLKVKTTSSKSKVVKVETKPVVKKVAVVKAITSKTVVAKESQLTLDVYDLNGKVSGKVTLDEAIFGAKVNKQLIAQAVRVYLANQRQGTRSTQTRGEVVGSTRKIYRQKGTGRARHGGIRAPIFVGGGVAWGPKPRDFSLNLPQRMKQQALVSALSAKVKDNEITVVSGFEDIQPKTKFMVAALNSLKVNSKMLLVINDGSANIVRSARNIDRVTLTSASRLNIYDVLTTKQLVISQKALENLEKRFKI